MMVNFDRVIMTCVIAHEVCPTPSVGVVWSTTVKEIAVKNQCVSCSEKKQHCLKLNIPQIFRIVLSEPKTIVLQYTNLKGLFHIIIFKTCSICQILKRII